MGRWLLRISFILFVSPPLSSFVEGRKLTICDGYSQSSDGDDGEPKTTIERTANSNILPPDSFFDPQTRFVPQIDHPLLSFFSSTCLDRYSIGCICSLFLICDLVFNGVIVISLLSHRIVSYVVKEMEGRKRMNGLQKE